MWPGLGDGAPDARAEPRRATVFCSHCWQYPLAEVAETLLARFPTPPPGGAGADEAVLWFDVFCVNGAGGPFSHFPFP